jgi:tetratricopeptide (TPR) repeat protein
LEELDNSYVRMPAPLNLAQVEAELRKEESKRNALFFTLASFDTTLPIDLRAESAEIADDLLSDREISEWLEHIISAQPLTQDKGTRDLQATALKFWSALRERIVNAQPFLRKLWASIELLKQSESIVEGEEDIAGLVEELLRSNTIPKFTKALAEKSIKDFNEALVGFSLNADNRKSYPMATRVLTKLRTILEEQDVFGSSALSLFANEQSDPRPNQKKHQTQPDLSTYETFSQVKKQIEGIRRLLLTGNRQAVDKAVSSLLEFHSAYGEKEHLAKSLCALTKIALDANEPHVADTLSLKAVELEIDDIVVLTSRAEVLKSLARFTEAQQMYEDVLQKYGKERYALCGYADVLMDQGQFDRALGVYETAVALYPDDPVASNGIVGVLMARRDTTAALLQSRKTAEQFGDVVSQTILGNILRHVGRYDESVRVMEAAAQRFSSEPRVWTGLLRSLRYAGRLEQALTKSSEFIERFSDYPSPYLMRGEILRAVGRLDESLDCYAKALKQFPNHRPAQIGKASVLTILGRTEEAESILEGLELESEADWIAYHVLCLSGLRAGQIDLAIEKLAWAREKVPWNRVRLAFSDSLGFAKLRAGKAREALPLLTEGLDAMEQQKKNVILLFLSTAYVQSGNSKAGNKLLQMARPTDPSGKAIKSLFQNGEGIQSGWRGKDSSTRFEVAAYDSLLSYAA